MPLLVPGLDDLSFEQLLEEAKRRIPAFTPEWTNFGIESDPGITLVQLFAFLTDALVYRASRITELNRLKFLKLLGIPLQPAAAASGIIRIRNTRAKRVAKPLAPGLVVSAGSVDFLTADGLNVLPIEGLVYYKSEVPPGDTRYQDFADRYEAIRLAEAAVSGTSTAAVALRFYEPKTMADPSPAETDPALDLSRTLDGCLYLALLAPAGTAADGLDTLRSAIAGQTLSVGLVPSVSGTVEPLPPKQSDTARSTAANLLFEMPGNPGPDPLSASYRPIQPLSGAGVSDQPAIVMLPLPDTAGLATWVFNDPLDEGTGDFPPRIEDDAIKSRLLTWLRIRLKPTTEGGSLPQLRLSWVGINAARIHQAVPVANESLGSGSGEPHQSFNLSNTPVLPSTVLIATRDAQSGAVVLWRRTDDLLAAQPDEAVFDLDPEAGLVRFGDGIRGARPPAGARLLADYKYGGGHQGNVGIGAVKASRDLPGGFTVDNPVPTSGGDLGETSADGEQRLPLVLRHRDRLVTAQDFRDIARRVPGVDVGRVEVLPLFRPGTPAERNAAGVVTLLALPLHDAINPLWPESDRLFLRRICDYLDQRRLITTELHLRGPVYQDVYLTVGIQARGDSFPDKVRQAVRDRLSLYLSSLPPGGPDGRGWPLGKRLLEQDLEAVVSRVPGVDYVTGVRLGLDATEQSPIELTDLALPRLASLAVDIGDAAGLDSLFANPQPAVADPDKVVQVPVLKTSC